jgi:hypothetical protein
MTITKELRDEIAFTTYAIQAFAEGFKMPQVKAYRFLKQYGGLNYIAENWWALHTDTPLMVLRELYDVCHASGGEL